MPVAMGDTKVSRGNTASAFTEPRGQWRRCKQSGGWTVTSAMKEKESYMVLVTDAQQDDMI